MKVHFLGTSASPSMPVPFCACEACRTARRAGGRNLRRRSSVLIDDAALVDLGPDIVTASFDQGVSLERVRLCLQTHPHGDHFDPELVISRHPEWGTTPAAPLVLVGSRKTLERMDALCRGRCAYGSIFDPAVQEVLSVQLRVVEAFQSLTFGSYRITAYPANHAPEYDSLLYGVEAPGEDGGRAVFYGTDTSVVSDAVWREMTQGGVSYDLVVLDHTYGPGRESTDHLAAADFAHCVKILNERGILKHGGSVYATHLSHEGIREHDELEKYASERGYQIAYDGLSLTL